MVAACEGLGGVDHREALAQLGQRLRGLGRVLRQAVADGAAEAGQALVQRLRQRPLLGLELLGQQGLHGGLGRGHLVEPAGQRRQRPAVAPAPLLAEVEQDRGQHADRREPDPGKKVQHALLLA